MTLRRIESNPATTLKYFENIPDAVPECFDIIYFCWTTWQLYKDVFHLFLLEHAHTDTSCEKRYNIVCMVAERLDATPKPPEIQPNIIFILVLTKVFLSLSFFFPLWAVMMTILFFGAVCASFPASSMRRLLWLISYSFISVGRLLFLGWYHTCSHFKVGLVCVLSGVKKKTNILQ